MRSGATLDEPDIHLRRLRSHRSGPGHRLRFLRMPGVNRQGQAHIASTAADLDLCEITFASETDFMRASRL